MNGPDGGARDDCLDDLVIARLVEGTTAPGERSIAIEHLATCGLCRGAVAGVANALRAPDVRRAVSPERFISRKTMVVALGMAATILLMVSVNREKELTSPHRGPVESMDPLPEPIGPVGTVSGLSRLYWHSIPGADRYRVTIFAADGGVLFETERADTAFIMPDSLQLAAGRTYFWRVDARTGFDRWVSSDLVEFTVPRGRQ